MRLIVVLLMFEIALMLMRLEILKRFCVGG